MGLLDFLSGKNARLLELQKRLVQGSPNRLVFSEKQLRKMAESEARNSLRIIKDSSKILQTTLKPDAFFSRFDLIAQHAENLAALSPWIKLKGASAATLKRETERQRDEITLDFLKRYYKAVSEKADGMKTPKGAENQRRKFYESLKPYRRRMSEECVSFIESTRQET